MKRLIIICFALLTTMPAWSQVQFRECSIDQAQEEASADGKLLLVDLYADWCGPCKVVDKRVFSSDDVGSYVNRQFIALKFNIDDEPGSSIVKSYGIRSVPRILIFNANGDLVTDFSPPRKPKEFLDKTKSAVRLSQVMQIMPKLEGE